MKVPSRCKARSCATDISNFVGTQSGQCSLKDKHDCFSALIIHKEWLGDFFSEYCFGRLWWLRDRVAINTMDCILRIHSEERRTGCLWSCETGSTCGYRAQSIVPNPFGYREQIHCAHKTSSFYIPRTVFCLMNVIYRSKNTEDEPVIRYFGLYLFWSAKILDSEQTENHNRRWIEWTSIHSCKPLLVR